MTSTRDLRSGKRAVTATMTRAASSSGLRAEVAEWRRRYAEGELRDIGFMNSEREVDPLYTALDVHRSTATDLSVPGQYPYTRGIHPTGYRGRLWTMRQFAGFGSAQRHERAIQVPARARTDGSVDGVRFPDADGLRLGSSALRGRGR